MKFSEKALALTCGILWGASMLIMGLVNILWSGYGQDFLKLMASIYPGYHASGSVAQLVVGTVYGTVDGLIGGFIFAWVYNRLVQS